MKRLLTSAIAAIVVTCATALSAAPLKLQPANPQPSGLKPGLSVRYAYPHDVKTLVDASSALKINSERGRPLSGLDYRDTNEGDPTLTSKRAEHVVAAITGYVHFDKPGIHNIDFLTNDGLRARIGGQVVGHFDGRQTCDTTIMSEVEVPSAGWYDLDILYFQRYGTACLHMRMGPAGKRVSWMANKAFGY
ncbi:PA14 domain-containing protein [Pseudophaeobacter flagellatus]|uniref:PA14 domain-containing protein n=1 Tax=Pseudophaeobacter flagellatus TaxID=2899119 RepID=UPI001E65BF2A|nr:PA14 domain-containing protein [Pseudophaeobacter flagellatus]MCD9149588.1 hypothetical protein [Pseudophaeobacter flagellatus]